MKLQKIVITLILLVVISYLYNNSSKIYYPIVDASTPSMENQLKTDVPVFKKSLSCSDFDSLQLSSSEDWGVQANSTFFIHQRMFLGLNREVNDLILVILPEKEVNAEGVIEETGQKEYYQMIKVGDYFVAKPEKLPSKPLFYFKSGHICFPYFNREKFSKSELLKNQYGGLIIRGKI